MLPVTAIHKSLSSLLKTSSNKNNIDPSFSYEERLPNIAGKKKINKKLTSTAQQIASATAILFSLSSQVQMHMAVSFALLSGFLSYKLELELHFVFAKWLQDGQSRLKIYQLKCRLDLIVLRVTHRSVQNLSNEF